MNIDNGGYYSAHCYFHNNTKSFRITSPSVENFMNAFENEILVQISCVNKDNNGVQTAGFFMSKHVMVSSLLASIVYSNHLKEIYPIQNVNIEISANFEAMKKQRDILIPHFPLRLECKFNDELGMLVKVDKKEHNFQYLCDSKEKKKMALDGAIVVKCCVYCSETRAKEPMKKLMVCSRCKNVYYCSKDCQVKHWKEHKQSCIKSHPNTQ